MPEYAYEALAETGAVQRGSRVAGSEAELESLLRGEGQYLIRAEPVAAVRPAHVDGRVDRGELVAFTDYLAASIHAGIPIIATLEDVEGRLTSKRFRAIVVELRHEMTVEGKALSEALASHPRAFSQLYVGTVEAGEATGRLDYALQQLGAYLDWQETIRGQVRQAMVYPAVVLTAALGLVAVLVLFVYPRLVPILTALQGIELPLPTRIVIGSADFVRAQWPWLLGGVAGGLLLLLGARRTERGRWWLHRVLLGVPVFGEFVRQVNMSRFVTYTALFYRTGVELIRGLTLVERMMGNRVVAGAVREAREAIVGGESLAHAFSRTGLFPPIVIRSLALGEATGQLDEALGRAKDYYDRELPAAVARLMTVLQPALIVGLGGVIALVALSIILPILSIYQSIGR